MIRCRQDDASQDIMKSYGQVQYSKHHYSKDRFEESYPKKERSRKKSHKRKAKYSLNSLSNLMTMPNGKTHNGRGSSYQQKSSNNKRRGINLNLNLIPSHPTMQTYQNPPLTQKAQSRHQRNMSSNNLQQKEKRREQKREQDFLQLSPTLTGGGKISASYGGYYPSKTSKVTRKERMSGHHQQTLNLERLDEAEEYLKKSTKDIERYKKGMKLRSGQKSRVSSKGHRRNKRSMEVDYDLKLDGHHSKKRR